MRKDIKEMLKIIKVRKGVKLSELTESLQKILLRFNALANGAGLHIKIRCTGRSLDIQKAYYAQGRKSKAEINVLRKKAGLYLLGNKEAKVIITKTMKSKHLIKDPNVDKSSAFDVVITDKKGRTKWDYKVDLDKDGVPDYVELAIIGKSLGLRCGADWKDYPHFEEV